MTDAAHNQHSETRRPSDRDRIVTIGPSPVSSPPVQKCCAERMSVSVAEIPKNRCRTTIPERMGETPAELPLTRDQVGLFRAQPGRPFGSYRRVAGDSCWIVRVRGGQST